MTPPFDSDRLLDPRGDLQRVHLELAPRPDAAALAAGSVLFYDNGKMDVGHYGCIFDRIKQGLRNNGIARFHDHRETIRGKTSTDIADMAQAFHALNVSAAVIGLADMGVSPAMVALTVVMEKLGMPTVCLTAGPGAQLSAAHTHYRAGALCLVPFDMYHASGAETVSTQADACVPRVISMLTSNGPELEILARVDYAIDTVPPSADGLISAPAAQDHAARDLDAIYEHFESLHIGDGLPFVPPTQARYEHMREYCPFDPGEVIVEGVGPSGTSLTIRDVLVAAVMAGCKPDYVPIVLTAVRAISRPPYGLLQAVTTSFGGGHFILASGPLASEIGMHGGQGCLGPGFRANATIGRAVNLVLLNVCRSVPGHADLACLSSPAEYSYCMAEEPALSPWRAMNEERFHSRTTCVMTLLSLIHI